MAEEDTPAGLPDWLGKFFQDWIKGAFDYQNDIWKWVKATFSWGWTTVVVAAALTVHYVIGIIQNIFDGLSAIIEKIVIPAFGLPDLASDVYQIANTFFPVTEALTFASSWFTFIGVMTIYRVVKSWIPSVSG